MTQVDNLDTVEVEVQLFGQFRNHLVVTQQDGVADAFSLRLYGSFQHSGVYSFSKYHTLWMSRGSSVELLSQFSLLTEQYRQRTLVFIPVLDGLAGHATLDGSLGNGSTHLCDETRVNRFRNEVLATEGEVVHLIDIVDHVGYRLFGKIGNSVNGSQLHLFVDGGSVNVECTTEDVWETNHVVDLVRIVSTTC